MLDIVDIKSKVKNKELEFYLLDGYSKILKKQLLIVME